MQYAQNSGIKIQNGKSYIVCFSPVLTFSVNFAFQGLDKFPEEETGTYVAKVSNSDFKVN